jgi:hypothetical protein
MIIAVDPGVNEAGVALFEDGELVAAWLSRGCGWHSTSRQVCSDVSGRFSPYALDEIVIEAPQIYKQRLLKGDPNDLVDVALCAGAVAGGLAAWSQEASVQVYFPAQWKKQVPKRIKNKRDIAKLTDEENGRVEWPRGKEDKTHVADAIGIGLYQLKRRS